MLFTTTLGIIDFFPIVQLLAWLTRVISEVILWLYQCPQILAGRLPAALIRLPRTAKLW